ncbi:MAG: TetR/AcrR family transcriptional regulator [Spirochaetes bacterium]|nr:TetR/AcrR family transcriptional regulator [Spirochaetota bacterium]
MKTKEEKAREKKKIIIEALKSRLTKSVYSQITVQDVADEAGFSKGGLLYYYATKEDLYMDLIHDFFSEMQRDHAAVIRGNLHSDEKASISALFVIEKLVLDRKNVRIFINLVLYGYEDPRIMELLQKHVRAHLDTFQDIITDARASLPSRRKTDYDAKFIARIAQLIVFSAGILESVDPIELDPLLLVQYMNSLFKG